MRHQAEPLRWARQSRALLATALAAYLGASALAPALAAGRIANGPARPMVFSQPQRLANSNGSTEPRIAVEPGGPDYIVSGTGTFSDGTYPITVYASKDDGRSWAATAGTPTPPSADVDIVATRTGRIVVATIGGDNAIGVIEVAYSDNGGRTWSQAGGLASLADQDRPWLAVGPDDSTTHKPKVYLLFHGLLSSNASQNMYVETSNDNGSTFGAPIPVTTPGSQAWLDLQCGASSGPSALLVDPRSGRLYVVWGARHGPAGGCGVLPVQPWTLVAENRVWAATSPSGALGTWTTSLAVDAPQSIVGMQLQGAALDTSGNLYVAYPESPRPFPDYSGASIRVRWATPNLRAWSQPVTVAPQGGPGNLLPEIVAGAQGDFAVSYLHGIATRGSGEPKWYLTATEVLQGKARHSQMTTTQIASTPAFSGTASQLEGVCPRDPAGDNNPLLCDRISDVWGIALDSHCHVLLSWGSASTKAEPILGASVDATWAASQVGGTTVCSTGT